MEIKQSLDLEQTFNATLDSGDKYAMYSEYTVRCLRCPLTGKQFKVGTMPFDYNAARAAQIAYTRDVLKRAARFFK